MVIRDLSPIMPTSVTQAATDLYDSWSDNWGILGTDSDIWVVDIDNKINQLRITVLNSLKALN